MKKISNNTFRLLECYLQQTQEGVDLLNLVIAENEYFDGLGSSATEKEKISIYIDKRIGEEFALKLNNFYCLYKDRAFNEYEIKHIQSLKSIASSKCKRDLLTLWKMVEKIEGINSNDISDILEHKEQILQLRVKYLKD